MIKVMICDDHTLMREGLKQILVAEHFSVVGEASEGDALIAQVRATEFDILLLDLSMPGRGGLELIRQVKNEKPNVRILILSMHSERQYAVRALRAGASGYLTKESAPSQLADAIKKIAGGGVFVSPAVGELLAMAQNGAQVDAPHVNLSDREFQVFRYLVQGVSVGDIAERLNLSSKTISTHKARLMEKLGVSNSVELIRYAMTHQLDGGRDSEQYSPPL